MNTLRRNSASARLNRILKSSHGGPGAKDETLELLCDILDGFLRPLLHKLAQLLDANATEVGLQGLSVPYLWSDGMQILDMDVDSSSINGIVDIPRDGGLSSYGKTWGHDDIGTIILCAESSTRPTGTDTIESPN